MQIHSSRKLIFSPRWDDECVVFDAHSGDFWIIDAGVAHTLELASTHPDHAAALDKNLPRLILEDLLTHKILQGGHCTSQQAL